MRWAGVTVDCLDVPRVARFWSALLDVPVRESLPGWLRLGPLLTQPVQLQPLQVQAVQVQPVQVQPHLARAGHRGLHRARGDQRGVRGRVQLAGRSAGTTASHGEVLCLVGTSFGAVEGARIGVRFDRGAAPQYAELAVTDDDQGREDATHSH